MKTALCLTAMLAASPALAAGLNDPSNLGGALGGDAVFGADAHPGMLRGSHAGASHRASGFSGRIEGRGAYSYVDDGALINALGGGSDLDGVSWTLRGVANINSGGLNLQLDGSGQTASVEGVKSHVLGGTAHAYYRPAGGSYAVGAFATLSEYDEPDLVINGLRIASEDPRDVMGGAEVALLSDMATLYLRGGYGQRTVGASEADLYHLGAGARIFAGPSMRFDLEGALTRAEALGGQSDAYAIQAKAVYRQPGKPYSVFAGVRRDHERLKSGGVVLGDSVSVNTLFAGARLHFGTQSLREEDRSGAVWDSLDPLP